MRSQADWSQQLPPGIDAVREAVHAPESLPLWIAVGRNYRAAGLTVRRQPGSTGRVTFSALSHLECSRDGSRHDADVVQGASPLGAPLLARYDLDRVAVTREEIASRPPTLWRYHGRCPCPPSRRARRAAATGLRPIPRRRPG